MRKITRHSFNILALVAIVIIGFAAGALAATTSPTPDCNDKRCDTDGGGGSYGNCYEKARYNCEENDPYFGCGSWYCEV